MLRESGRVEIERVTTNRNTCCGRQAEEKERERERESEREREKERERERERVLPSRFVFQ